MVTRMTIDSVVLSTYGKVLGIVPEKLPSGETFVNLGGNSLRAAEIAEALKKTYPSLEITPQDVYRCRTASGLIDFIRTQGIK